MDERWESTPRLTTVPANTTRGNLACAFSDLKELDLSVYLYSSCRYRYIAFSQGLRAVWFPSSCWGNGLIYTRRGTKVKAFSFIDLARKQRTHLFSIPTYIGKAHCWLSPQQLIMHTAAEHISRYSRKFLSKATRLSGTKNSCRFRRFYTVQSRHKEKVVKKS